MPNHFRTAYLADHPDLIPAIAAWLYAEWGHTYPDGSPRHAEEALLERCQRGRLPLALVGFAGHEPMSTASLKIRELETHPHLEHWLGTVFVLPHYRRQGYGAKIVQAAEHEARLLGLEQLYLYTRHSETFYADLGWESIERPMYRNRPAIIMQRMLNPTRDERQG